MNTVKIERKWNYNIELQNAEITENVRKKLFWIGWKLKSLLEF